jgi:hypothetical protein
VRRRAWEVHACGVPAAKDLYDELQVSRSAEPEVIEAAYRRLARKYHPDVSNDPASAARMQRIIHAYTVLSDPRRRAEYDLTLPAGTSLYQGSRYVWVAIAVVLLLVLAVPVLRLLLVRGIVFVAAAALALAIGFYVWRGLRSSGDRGGNGPAPRH